MRLTRKTIDGKVNRYANWRKKVVALADERQIPDTVRDQVTEPMMQDGWDKNETPGHFLATVVECFGRRV